MFVVHVCMFQHMYNNLCAVSISDCFDMDFLVFKHKHTIYKLIYVYIHRHDAWIKYETIP